MKAIDKVISADEIGLYSAVLDAQVARSAFQLVYRRQGNMLVAAAAEGFARLFRQGKLLPTASYLRHMRDDQAAFVEQLFATLHLVNHRYIGIDHLDHMLAIRSSESLLPIKTLGQRLEEADIDTAQLVCLIRDPGAFSIGDLIVWAQAWRDFGARVALGSREQPDLQAIMRINPDIVCIDGFWFKRVCQSASALQLLGSFVRGLQEQGRRVVIEGLETQVQLSAALDTGADMLRGYFLAQPQLAGMEPLPEQLETASLFYDGAEIVSFSGNPLNW